MKLPKDFGLNHVQTANVTFTALFQLSRIVMWLVLAVFHLALLTALLLLLWYFQVNPKDVTGWAKAISNSGAATTIGVAVGIAGVSALGGLVAYVKIWRRIYARFAVPFLLAGIGPSNQ